MDPLTVITTCSLAKDFTLVLGLMIAFSHGEPNTVHAALDVGLEGNLFLDEPGAVGGVQQRTASAALAELKRVKDPVVGLLPVPVAWAGLYDFEPKDLLDPCINVTVATAQLSDFERRCERRGRDQRACALHEYVVAAQVPLLELEVLDTIRQQRLPSSAKAVVVETEELLGSDIFVYPQPDARGVDRIFVPTSPPSTAETNASRPRLRKKPNNNMNKEVPRHDTNKSPAVDNQSDRREQLADGLPR